MNKKRVFSGIRPSGDLHLGNYLGAIQAWLKLQKKYDCIFAVVDYHAITTPFQPKELNRQTINLAKWLIASGIQPRQSALILQSAISEHTELAWILNCLTPLGELQRMIQFKEKSRQQGKNIASGLLTYPTLMAADILLYQTNLVPVGDDQKQHLEFTQQTARRFNHRFQAVFTIPQAHFSQGARIMSLKHPEQKMSKTGGHGILLSDPPQLIKNKIAKAVTDEKPNTSMSPGVKNLFQILNALNPQVAAQLERKYWSKKLRYSELKATLTEIVIHTLQPIQKKYQYISDQEIKKIFQRSQARVQPIAKKTLQQAKRAIGIS